MIPLWAFLLFSSALFGIGLYGAMTKRNAVRILMSIELMLNAANINLVAFNLYGPLKTKATETDTLNLAMRLFGGQTLTFFAIGLAAAEAAVGLSILLILYRNWEKIDISEMDILKG
ncbi:MAG: NADH-quinone oxidoreductase subunit NuoK [Candidatus Hodarchaeales archaeon]|jgi:NADH-quinone oxidoreductase subunit K